QELKVIGRTSSFQFKGKTDDSKTIGEKLGVYYLLEGSVRKSADRVRIAVALITSSDGANVWSESYDRELKDIVAAQSEIAGRALELAPQNAAVTANLAGLVATLGRFDEAVALMQRAIVLDPLRSQSHFNPAVFLIALGRYDEAEAALHKAIELQPQSGQNYA